eukprot:scaffold39196_cov62-Phaeocystis_antarctica.AAC.1
MQLADVRAKARDMLQGDAAAGKRCRQMASALYGNGVHLHLLVGLSGHAPADEGCRGRWRSVRANWFVEDLGAARRRVVRRGSHALPLPPPALLCAAGPLERPHQRLELCQLRPQLLIFRLEHRHFRLELLVLLMH